MEPLTALRRARVSRLLPGLLIGALASTSDRPPAVDWAKRLEVASGDAYQGPWRMNESRFRYVDDPTVAFDGAGAVGVAWADQLRKNVFFQPYSPDGRRRLAKPTNVSRSARVFSWHPRMVIPLDDPSQVFVLWQEIVFSGGSHGGEIFFARSTDGGRSFGPALNLSRSRAGDGKGRLIDRLWHNGSLDLAQAGDGTLYAAWTEYEGALWVSRSTDGGRGFSRPTRVGEATRPSRRGAPRSPRGPGAPSTSRGPSATIPPRTSTSRDRTTKGARSGRVTVSSRGGRVFAAPSVVPGSVDPTLGHNGGRQGLLLKKLAVHAGGEIAVVSSTFREGDASHIWLFRGRRADGR